MKRSVVSVVKVLSAPVLAGVLLTGCLKKSDISPTPVTSYVSIMHMAATAPSTEVYIDDVRQTNAMAFGNYFSSYGGIEPGVKQIKFKKAGSDSLIAAIPSSLYDSLAFATLVLYDDPQVPGTAKALKVGDDFSALTIDKVSCRFFNLSPSAGEVDFFLDDSKVSAGRTNADIAFDNSLTGFQSFDQGTYTIKARYIDTDSVLTEKAVSLSNGNAYTVVLRGDANSDEDAKKLGLEVIRAAN